MCTPRMEMHLVSRRLYSSNTCCAAACHRRQRRRSAPPSPWSHLWCLLFPCTCDPWRTAQQKISGCQVQWTWWLRHVRRASSHPPVGKVKAQPMVDCSIPAFDNASYCCSPNLKYLHCPHRGRTQLSLKMPHAVFVCLSGHLSVLCSRTPATYSARYCLRQVILPTSLLSSRPRPGDCRSPELL